MVCCFCEGEPLDAERPDDDGKGALARPECGHKADQADQPALEKRPTRPRGDTADGDARGVGRGLVEATDAGLCDRSETTTSPCGTPLRGPCSLRSPAWGREGPSAVAGRAAACSAPPEPLPRPPLPWLA